MKRICSIDNEYRDAYIDWDELEYVRKLPLNPFYHGRFTYTNLPSALDLHPGVPRTRGVEEEVDGRTERMLALSLSFHPLIRLNETKPGGWLFVFDAVRPREWGISIPGTRAWGMGRCVASMATGLVEVTTFAPRDLAVFEGPSWGSKSDREGGVWVLVVHSLHRHFSSGPLRVLVENGRQESPPPPPGGKVMPHFSWW